MRPTGLERRAWPAYSLPMDDTTHHKPPADWDDPPMPGKADLLAALARSETEHAAGLNKPAEAVHRRIRDTIARIKARKHGGQTAAVG